MEREERQSEAYHLGYEHGLKDAQQIVPSADRDSLRRALREAIHDTLDHSMDSKSGFRWYWQTDEGTPNDLADAVMARLPAALASPVAAPDDLGAAWAAVEAVLPEGWVFECGDFSDAETNPEKRYWAHGIGPESEGVHVIEGTGCPTPAAALRALAARLATEDAKDAPTDELPVPYMGRGGNE